VQATLLGQELHADAGVRYTVCFWLEWEKIGNKCWSWGHHQMSRSE